MTPPLAAAPRLEDAEEEQLIQVLAKFTRRFGADAAKWEPRVQRVYVQTQEAVHASYHPQAVAS
jgi:hypothetical protein